MALAITVTRGHTFVSGVRYNTDDLNAAALPTITISGAVGTSDLAPGSIDSTLIRPGPIAYAQASGADGDYLLTLNPPLTALTAGAWVSFKANHTNPGPARLNVNSLGLKSIAKFCNVHCVAGDICSGGLYWVQYDGTAWQLHSTPGFPRTVFAADTGVANALVLALPDLGFVVYDDLLGLVISTKAAANNTGATTVAINGKAAQPLQKEGATVLVAGDVEAGSIISFVWDGDKFQLTTPSPNANLPNVGPGAGTYASPTSVSLDAQGRVTAIAAGTAAVGGVKAWATFNGTTATATKAVSTTDAGTNTLVVTGHSYIASQLVWLDAGHTVGGATAGTAYYVEVVDANTIRLHPTPALGAAVDITSDGGVSGDFRTWASNPILASSGIDGITRVSVGLYRVDFTTAQAHANYAVLPAAQIGSTDSTEALLYTVTFAPTTGAFEVATVTGGVAADCSRLSIAVLA